VISTLAFTLLVWGSLAVVAASFGYVLVTTLREFVQSREEHPDPSEVGR
jgi:hypothetical protein